MLTFFLEKSRPKQRKKGSEEDCNDDVTEDGGLDASSANQQLQLMQMQLQFERQRREVHAERNRRLLGKLRDSRALEEHNTALVKKRPHKRSKHKIDCVDYSSLT